MSGVPYRERTDEFYTPLQHVQFDLIPEDRGDVNNEPAKVQPPCSTCDLSSSILSLTCLQCERSVSISWCPFEFHSADGKRPSQFPFTTRHHRYHTRRPGSRHSPNVSLSEIVVELDLGITTTTNLSVRVEGRWKGRIPPCLDSTTTPK